MKVPEKKPEKGINTFLFIFSIIYLYFNPEPTPSHGHGHDDKGHHGDEHVSVWTYIKLGLAVFIFIFCVLYSYFNPDFTNTFITILNIIQIFTLVIIAFLAYKLWFFMKEFSKTGGEIVSNYESKIKHHHHEHNGHSQLEEKYNNAMQQLSSVVDSEWKSGLVELDNYIRLVLLEKNYAGDTTLELLNDAKLKGLKHVEEAENIAYLRKRLKTKGVHFDFSKQELDILVKKFAEFRKILNENNH